MYIYTILLFVENGTSTATQQPGPTIPETPTNVFVNQPCHSCLYVSTTQQQLSGHLLVHPLGISFFHLRFTLPLSHTHRTHTHTPSLSPFSPLHPPPPLSLSLSLSLFFLHVATLVFYILLFF